MKILTRLNIIIFLLFIQLLAFGVIAYRLFYHFPFILYIGIAISFIVLLSLLKKEKPSAFKLTWIIVVLLFLPLGGIIYLFFGDKRPTQKVKKYLEEHALIQKYLEAVPASNMTEAENSGRMAGLFNYICRYSSYHAYEDIAINYYAKGEIMFDDLLIDLKNAQQFIFLEYFIIKESSMWEQVLSVLTDKVKSGVDVRLIVDDFGSMKLFTNRYIKQLRNQGIKVVRFNPLRPLFLMFMNNRDHRKIIVIDGKLAYNGGANIADEYINVKKRFGVWKDTGVRIHGPAVWSFTLMFIEMWDVFCRSDERINDHESFKCPDEDFYFRGPGLVLPFGDSPLDNEQVGENIYIDILDQAQHYVYIFTPYLIISENLIHAMQLASKRGVDVKIVTPAIPDKRLVFRLTRSYYRFLREAGVKIYEYTPGFIHAKSFVSDDLIAVVGTINLDYRSLYLHFECATLFYDHPVIREIKEDVLSTIAQSSEVKAHPTRMPLLGRFIDAILHLFAPLM